MDYGKYGITQGGSDLDWMKITSYGKKYAWPVGVLLVGIILLLLPGKSTGETSEPGIIESVDNILSLEEALSEILSTVQGAGKVRVMLSVASGEETLYQTDGGEKATRIDTVILTDSNRNQSGLVKQILSPHYRGAVVVCEGADRASVRLAVVDAVVCATGLSSDHITVLKMK